MKEMSGSYESLFSRVALKYKTLDPKPTKEAEYKKLILSEYTFLKQSLISMLSTSVFVLIDSSFFYLNLNNSDFDV